VFSSSSIGLPIVGGRGVGKREEIPIRSRPWSTTPKLWVYPQDRSNPVVFMYPLGVGIIGILLYILMVTHDCDYIIILCRVPVRELGKNPRNPRIPYSATGPCILINVLFGGNVRERLEIGGREPAKTGIFRYSVEGVKNHPSKWDKTPKNPCVAFTHSVKTDICLVL